MSLTIKNIEVIHKNRDLMSYWADLLMDEWSWSITWGWYQIALGLLCSSIIFIGMRRLKSLPAIVLVVTSYWSAFIVYCLLMGLSCVYAFGTAHASVHIVYNPMASLLLGLLFSVVQALFLNMVHHWYRVQLLCVLSVTLLGNSMAAFLAFCLNRFILVIS
jgi:hypothetical protein